MRVRWTQQKVQERRHRSRNVPSNIRGGSGGRSTRRIGQGREAGGHPQGNGDGQTGNGQIRRPHRGASVHSEQRRRRQVQAFHVFLPIANVLEDLGLFGSSDSER